MPAIRPSRPRQPLFSNQVTPRTAPPSAATFAHSLLHEVTQHTDAAQRARVFARHGVEPHATGPAIRLDRRWREQVATRRRWFEHQTGSNRAAQPEAGLTMIAAADADADAHSCAHHASLSAAREHKGGCAHSHHQDSRGLLMVDLDEAAHGVYASVKQSLPMLDGQGTGALRDEFVQQIDQLGRDPLGWMAHEVPPGGVADFSAAMGTSALVAPLALIALKAGVHETRDARRIARALKQRSQELATTLDTTTPLQAPGTPTLASVLHTQTQRAAADTRFAKRLNRLRMGIGIASAASGATIFAKTTTDIGIKAALVASAKKLNVVHWVSDHAAATVAATAAGVAGTLVLGPLAGIFATLLGGFFARKSALRHRAFRQDRARVEGFLRTAKEQQHTQGEVDAVRAKYHAFLERKLPERARFYGLFKRWNMSFLGGSTLYAATALTKMGLGIAALAGAGALISNPIGWGVLLGVGVVGAVIMGVSSWQFLFGHPKNERYERYSRDDDPELDRHFLAGADLLATDSNESWAGLDLRARCLDTLDKRSASLSHFKHEVARALGKKAVASMGDFFPNLMARCRAAGAGTATLLGTASLRQARARAAHSWGAHARQVTAPALARWLNADTPPSAWRNFAHQTLHTQRAFLEHKLALRLKMYEQRPAWQNLEQESDASRLAAQAALLAKLDAAAERDQANLERIQLLLDAQQDGTGDPARDDRLLLGLLGAVQPAALDGMDINTVREELATVVLKDLPRRLRDMKGMLLDTELQAARLRATACEKLKTA